MIPAVDRKRISACPRSSHAVDPIRDASTNPQTDRAPGMIRPGNETQRGTAQPAIAISHPATRRARWAAATKKNTEPQTRRYVF